MMIVFIKHFDITYKKPKLTILHSVNTVVTPGHIVAPMGNILKQIPVARGSVFIAVDSLTGTESVLKQLAAQSQRFWTEEKSPRNKHLQIRMYLGKNRRTVTISEHLVGAAE